MGDPLMRIYFDYNATTPLAPEVVDAVVAATRDQFGNASSVHHFGQRAKAVLDEARSAVAALIHADPSEIVYTSGGTEADNLALRGAPPPQPESVRTPPKARPRYGWRTPFIPVDPTGIVHVNRLREAMANDTAL